MSTAGPEATPATLEPDRSAPGSAQDHDDLLVEAFRAGDARAFEELYARCQPALIARLRRRCGDDWLAEDIAQEAFIRAARHIHSPGAAYFRPWLHRIAANLCVDHFRSVSRHPATTSLHQRMECVLGVRVVDAEDQAARNELAREVWRSLQRLSPRHRTVLVLREIEGLDYRSIAAEMGISLSAVETLLFRARARLRDRLRAC